MVSCALKRAVEDDHIRSIPKMPRQFGERKRTYVLNEEQFDKMMDAVRTRDDREQTVATTASRLSAAATRSPAR